MSSRTMGFIIPRLFSLLLGNQPRNAPLDLIYIPPADAQACCSAHVGLGFQIGAAASRSFTATSSWSRASLLETSPKVGLA